MGETNEMTWQEIVKEAKEKGYDPTKDEKVISNRNQIMQETAKERLAKEKAESQLYIFEGEVKSLNEQLRDMKKTLSQKENELSDLQSKIVNFEEIEKKAKSWEDYNESKQKSLAEKLNNKIKEWEQLDKESLKLLPDDYEQEDKEKILKLMEKLEPKIFDGKSRTDLNVAPKTSTREFSDDVKKFAAARGTSLEAADRILKRKKEKENK